MRGDDEVPHVGGEGAECIGTCLSKVRSELQDASPEDVLHEMQAYCESQAMVDFCARHGVNDITFRWNPHLQCRRRFFRRNSHGRLYQHFWKAYQENPSLNLALAFHGTAEANVPKILHHGLDPQYRRTQAFGNGEYFSKEPGLAATYRHEGHCLLVFLLLMPQDHEKLFSQKDRDIVVVPELSHQLPLGVLHFDSVDEHKIQHSQDMRMEQRHLKQAAMECDWQLSQARMVEQVTRLLKKKHPDQAAEVFHEATKYHKLTKEVQGVLSARVRDYIPDQDLREALFPALATVEPRLSEMPSIPVLEEQAQKAWDAFLEMKMDPYRNIELERPLASCAVQLKQQRPTMAGARVLLDHC